MDRPYDLIKGIRSKASPASLTSVLYRHRFKELK
jgi:hypothetical protein